MRPCTFHQWLSIQNNQRGHRTDCIVATRGGYEGFASNSSDGAALSIAAGVDQVIDRAVSLHYAPVRCV
jgi:hypothetical protein